MTEGRRLIYNSLWRLYLWRNYHPNHDDGRVCESGRETNVRNIWLRHQLRRNYSSTAFSAGRRIGFDLSNEAAEDFLARDLDDCCVCVRGTVIHEERFAAVDDAAWKDHAGHEALAFVVGSRLEDG